MVKTNLKLTNINHSDAIEKYLTKRLTKIERLLKNVQDEIILRVELEKTTDHHKQGEIFRAEIQTHVLGKNHRAEGVKEDIYSAIDEAKLALVRELTSEKGKKDTLLKKGGRRIKEMLRRR